MDSILQPEHIGLALETNLIRDAAPDSIYQGVKQAASGAAQDLKARGSDARLSVSVHVENAWGKLTNTAYKGIDQDLTDFPFVEELGISSYPYLGFEKPEDIPLDYYAKLTEGKSLDVFVAEGGWCSESVDTSSLSFSSSPEIQKAYITRHAELLDQVNAIAYFQLSFTDFDEKTLPQDISPTLNYFLSLGLVDVELKTKPALSAWDEIFARTFIGSN